MSGKITIQILTCCIFSFSIKFKLSVMIYVELVRTYVTVN